MFAANFMKLPNETSRLPGDVTSILLQIQIYVYLLNFFYLSVNLVYLRHVNNAFDSLVLLFLWMIFVAILYPIFVFLVC